MFLNYMTEDGTSIDDEDEYFASYDEENEEERD